MSGISTEADLLDQLGNARRITIVGPPDSGKSTLARQLGQQLDLPQRLERADAVIFLQPNRWKSLYRVVLRTLKHHGQTRPDMPENCPERFSWEFLRYVWRWEKDEMPETVGFLAEVKGRLKVLCF